MALNARHQAATMRMTLSKNGHSYGFILTEEIVALQKQDEVACEMLLLMRD